MNQSETSEQAPEKTRGSIAQPADMKAAAIAMADEFRDAAKAKAETLRRQLEDYVRRDPIRAILTALGVGVLIGGLLRK